MSRPSFGARAFAAAALLACATSASALWVDMYAIGDFVPGGSGGCGSDDRGAWPGMVEAWYNRMGNFGHLKTGKFVDGNMTTRRFCDSSSALGAGCADTTYSDYPDAAIIATHGFDAGNRWGGVMRAPWNGSCALEAGSGGTASWGDSWIVFLHASSCYSMNDNYLNGMRQAMTDPATSSTRRAHQIDGFHGIMWIGSSLNNDYKETANDGHFVSVAQSWVTNHFKNNSVGCEWYDPWNVFGTCQDQCPVAYSIGSTEGDALTRLNFERYNFVYGDPTSSSWYAYKYYAGCNPVGDGPFNP